MAEIKFTDAELAREIALDKAKAEARIRIEQEQVNAEAKAKAEATAKKAKAEEDAKAAKRESVLKTLNAAADGFYDKEVIGTILPYTEKGGSKAPAMVIKEGFKKVMEGEAGKEKEVLKLELTFLVFSIEAIQPYKAVTLY